MVGRPLVVATEGRIVMDRLRSRRAALKARCLPTYRSAMTPTEVLVVLGVAIFLVTVIVILPMMEPRSHSLSPRAACAANLSGIGKGLYTYATENSDLFPIAAHAPAEGDEVGRVKYAPGMIGTHRGREGEPKSGETTEKDTEMSTTRNLWSLVRVGSHSPRSMICPCSTDQADDEDTPADYWDFRAWKEVSYGYQVPYGKRGRPSSECDQRMPLVADKGPYGAALEGERASPGPPNLASTSSPKDWMSWNSPNHAGEGQMVLFADSHAEFMQTPICGAKNDNIYTRWSAADGGGTSSLLPRVQGTPPTGTETPWSDTDSLIYP
jgi:hypothetical protein